MAMNNPYSKYKQNSVETASPGDLTLMLYNGCLKFIKLGKKGIEENNIEVRNTNIAKAQNIIKELMVTLNMDIPVSENLMQMYDYLNRRLIEANVKSAPEILDEVEEFVIELRDTWKEVIKTNRQTQYAGEEKI